MAKDLHTTRITTVKFKRTSKSNLETGIRVLSDCGSTDSIVDLFGNKVKEVYAFNEHSHEGCFVLKTEN